MRKARTSIQDDQIGVVIAEYRDGAHTTALAARYGVTQPTISYLLRKHGVRLRYRAETNRMRAPVDDAELARLNDEAKLSQREIAEHLRVSLPTIERALRRLGLKSKRGRGSPLERNYFWKGGERVEREGYVLLKTPGHPYANKAGYVREHRLVMERVLGRYLLQDEEVHHRDDDPRNNHPDNLQVFASHAEHMRYHWAEQWHRAYQQRREAPQPGDLQDATSHSALETDAAA